jgi:hypothetical protein
MMIRFFIFLCFNEVGQRIGKTQTSFSEDTWLETRLYFTRKLEASHTFPQSLQENDKFVP